MHPVIPVACGVLINSRGEVLIAQRPQGKVAAGEWEFPGGKIEHEESARAALLRELHEELGITVREARPLIRVTHQYSDRTVILDTWLISAWDGELHGRENQALAWCRPEHLADYALLAADKPIAGALCLPPHYVFTPPRVTEPELLRGLARLPRAALLRLRLPELNDLAYLRLARLLLQQCRPFAIQLLLDREPEQVLQLGAAGWHGSVARVGRLRQRPLPEEFWFAGSAHSAEELERLKQLGADCAVLGPVQATSTHQGQPALGWEKFSTLIAGADLPVYAIGGVGPHDHARAFAHYAQGTAGISAYWNFSS